MQYTFLFLCLCALFQHGISVMTEKQIAATVKLIRNTCINKQGATPEKVDAMHKGDFDFSDKKLMCYMHCVLMTYKLMKKDNTLDWEEGIIVLSTQAPPSIAVPGIASFKNCKTAVKTPDNKCKAAFEIAKCLYEDDAEHYFLP